MKNIKLFAEKSINLAIENNDISSPLSKLHASYCELGKSDLLIDEAITLLFAGQDTSAATLSWCLYLLGKNHKYQDVILKELTTQGDDDNNNNNSDMLEYCVKESMRLYPVAPFVVRNIVEDIVIPADKSLAVVAAAAEMENLTLTKGSLACIWIYSLHRNP